MAIMRDGKENDIFYSPVNILLQSPPSALYFLGNVYLTYRRHIFAISMLLGFSDRF